MALRMKCLTYCLPSAHQKIFTLPWYVTHTVARVMFTGWLVQQGCAVEHWMVWILWLKKIIIHKLQDLNRCDVWTFNCDSHQFYIKYKSQNRHDLALVTQLGPGRQVRWVILEEGSKVIQLQLQHFPPRGQYESREQCIEWNTILTERSAYHVLTGSFPSNQWKSGPSAVIQKLQPSFVSISRDALRFALLLYFSANTILTLYLFS